MKSRVVAVPGPAICDAVPAEQPLLCRRGIRVIQGRRPPRCGGVLRADLGMVRRMLEMGGSPTVSCPECRIRHGFILAASGTLYGALL